MNIKIIEEKENLTLKRKEVIAEVEAPDKTPSNQELKKEFASLLKAKEELIFIKNIAQVFGKRTSNVEVYVYKDEASLKQIEKPVEEKPKEAPAPTEAPKPEVKKEEKPEEKKEAPAEQPKEEPKPEEKPAEEKKE